MPLNSPQPPPAPLVPPPPDIYSKKPQSKPDSALTQPKKTPSKSTIISLAIFSAILPLAIVGIVFYLLLGPMYEQDLIRENGLPASGTIVGVRDTGSSFNNQPQVEITVDVKTPEGETYRTKTYMIISHFDLPQFQRGTNVNIKYDPRDRTKIAIE